MTYWAWKELEPPLIKHIAPFQDLKKWEAHGEELGDDFFPPKLRVDTNSTIFLLFLQLCDISLVVGNQTIKAHKVILASASPYFYAMFNG